jgi:hypothetical protein
MNLEMTLLGIIATIAVTAILFALAAAWCRHRQKKMPRGWNKPY